MASCAMNHQVVHYIMEQKISVIVGTDNKGLYVFIVNVSIDFTQFTQSTQFSSKSTSAIPQRHPKIHLIIGNRKTL